RVSRAHLQDEARRHGARRPRKVRQAGQAGRGDPRDRVSVRERAVCRGAPELARAEADAAIEVTRVSSIDAFRGFVMFLMLAEAMRLWTLEAAYPGSTFWAVVAFNTTHVPWRGCSLHDLIQPA